MFTVLNFGEKINIDFYFIFSLDLDLDFLESLWVYRFEEGWWLRQRKKKNKVVMVYKGCIWCIWICLMKFMEDDEDNEDWKGRRKVKIK